MLHEVQVNTLEMNKNIDLLSRKIKAIFKTEKENMSMWNLKVTKWAQKQNGDDRGKESANLKIDQ